MLMLIIMSLFAGFVSSLHSVQLDEGGKSIPEETETAVEALYASCIVQTAPDPSHDGSKGQCHS